MANGRFRPGWTGYRLRFPRFPLSPGRERSKPAGANKGMREASAGMHAKASQRPAVGLIRSMKGVWSIERRDRKANNSIQSAVTNATRREVIAVLDLGSLERLAESTGRQSRESTSAPGRCASFAPAGRLFFYRAASALDRVAQRSPSGISVRSSRRRAP